MKGIEVSVLTEAELREDAHPYATECHYSLFWDEYVREAGWENWNQELRRDMLNRVLIQCPPHGSVEKCLK